VKFRGIEGGAEKEHDKSKKYQSMHDAGIRIGQGLELEKPILQKRFYPFVAVVRPVFRFADGRPHQPSPIHTIGKDGQGDKGQGKEDGFEMLGIPEYLPPFMADRKIR